MTLASVEVSIRKNRAIINKRSERTLSVLMCKSETFILLMELLVHLFSLTAQNMTHFLIMCVHFIYFFFLNRRGNHIQCSEKNSIHDTISDLKGKSNFLFNVVMKYNVM